MRMLTLRKARPVDAPGRSGVVRLDRRTKNLTKRLRPGEIAVIDHIDLDKVSADALVTCGAAAVVNAAPSISGRYPNLGPEILAAAGVPLLDNVGDDIFSAVPEGELVRLDGDTLYAGDRIVAKGTEQTVESVTASMAEARAGLAMQLEAFAANTMEFLRRERDLLLDGVGVPDIRTPIDGRHVLIVVRGYHYREDLQTLRPYIREYRPVLIGVDGGADALLEAGHRPDLIVGDMDSVSDACLRCGAEIVVHAYRDGTRRDSSGCRTWASTRSCSPPPAPARTSRCCSPTTRAPSLIVAVGTHATLDRVPRQGPRRYGEHVPHPAARRRQARRRQGREPALPRPDQRRTLCLVVATLVTLIIAASISPAGQVYIGILHARWDSHLLLAARAPVSVVDFRYHIVSIVAVFLALAVGIVLGTYTINSSLLKDIKHRASDLRHENDGLRNRIRDLGAPTRSRPVVPQQQSSHSSSLRAIGETTRSHRSSARRVERAGQERRRHRRGQRRDSHRHRQAGEGLGRPDAARPPRRPRCSTRRARDHAADRVRLRTCRPRSRCELCCATRRKPRLGHPDR